MDMSLPAEAIRLKKLRDYLDYSQRDLAKEFQVTSGAIAQWESGKRPLPGPIVKLMEIYETSIQNLNVTSSAISTESLENSRELLNSIIQSLKVEGISVSENAKENIGWLVDQYLASSQGPVVNRLKIALAQQVIKSFDGSRGLAVKAAQLAVFIENGLPPEVSVFLGELLSNVKPLPFAVIERTLQEAYGDAYSKIFSKVQKTAHRVTSVAQLHLATLSSGENVILKIRHPKIDEVLGKQFKKLSFLNSLQKIFGSSLDEVLLDIEEQVMMELDYEREVQHQIKFKEIFKHEPRIVVPQVYAEHCRQNVIVSQFEPGLSFDTFKQRSSQAERNLAGQVISYFHSFAIFEKHLMHSDPHPGNFLFRPNQVIFVDFGRVTEMSPADVEKERQLFTFLLTRNEEAVMREFRESGMIKNPESFDYAGFWELLQEQQFHHLTQGTVKITTERLKYIESKRKAFKGIRQIILSKRLVRSSIINVSLINLFAALEAEYNWRKQAGEILKIPANLL